MMCPVHEDQEKTSTCCGGTAVADSWQTENVAACGRCHDWAEFNCAECCYNEKEEANERLMASAPALVAALESLLTLPWAEDTFAKAQDTMRDATEGGQQR